MSLAQNNSFASRVLGTALIVGLGSLLTAIFFQTCLSSSSISGNFCSPSTWYRFVSQFHPAGTVDPRSEQVPVPLSAVLVLSAAVSVLSWLGGSAFVSLRRRTSFPEALITWGWCGWFWWCAVDLWEWSWIGASAVGLSSLSDLLSVVPQFWLAFCFAGWLTTLAIVSQPETSSDTQTSSVRSLRWKALAVSVYVIVFTTMNWRLYGNLLVPHGDSVMYEEHLWNILHGKGFRSYLDQGLFLGEHIQLVHLFLLPLYIIWPSHLLLEACSSTALACGAFPVYWMVRRHTDNSKMAFAAAVAYLLYSPMQFLDIEIDLKTFRPESFGIPLLLLTLDQLDRRNLFGFFAGIAMCLTVKEDYTLIFGPLGVWIALSHPATDPALSRRDAICFASRRNRLVLGLGLSCFSVGYLWLATRVIMKWFRSGVEVHYTSYFAKFGDSPEKIVQTMLTRPGMVLESFVTIETTIYAIALLAPLAFIPILSPGRLAVGLPLFGILCLNELEKSRSPQHQFHAPLVAIIFWALAGALPTFSKWIRMALARFAPKATFPDGLSTSIPRHLIWTSALATGIFFSLSPLGIPFWDSGSSWYWGTLYGHSKRAQMFSRIKNVIPQSARVASTDFVHPRYTHHERSYDYSNYQRKVSGEGRRIPEDTDYVVIDTQHRYSTIKRPDEVPEYRDHPGEWELLPDETDGYFIILKRKRPTEQ